MRIIADLHIHSPYSRAVSKEMTLENLDYWARKKGITVMGTGDFTHPAWIKEIKTKLEPAEQGLYRLKPETRSPIRLGTKPETNSKFRIPNYQTRFMLTVEISSIYSKGGKARRIHNLIFVPSVESAEKINAELGWRGNLKSDGRPILGLDAKELAKIVLNVDSRAMVIPAHCWTPWFSIFGSMSGFDSIDECFEEYSKYIYAVETGLSCYDQKTEVLTDNGWKKFTEVKYKDSICTLNPTTNRVEFQKPTKIYTHLHKGKMYRLKTKRVDLLVTPNHKLLVDGCDFRRPPRFFLKEAEYLFGKSKRFKKDGIWVGESKPHFSLPAVKIKHGSRFYSGYRFKKEKQLSIKPWLKFFGFWIAEGWVTGGKDGAYSVCLSNRDETLLSEMKKILEDFGYNTYWDKKVTHTLRVRDYQLYHYLKQFGKCSDKFIPQEIKSLSKEFLEIVFEYYIKGDGHRYGRANKGLSATTISIRLRDDLQEIALKMGISAYYKLGYKKGRPILSLPKANTKGYKQSADSWIIYFIRKNIHTVIPSAIKKFNYTEAWVKFRGPVYCVTVPNHVIYIRRNGIPVWCGNSDPAMNWRWSHLDKVALISNSDSHSLHRIGREANIFDTGLSYDSIVEAIKSHDPKKFLYTIEFYPEEGKYHYDGHRLCKVRLSPEETKRANNLCPSCGKPVTVGVMNRVEALADHLHGRKPERAIPFKSLVPLDEIIAESLGLGTAAKRVKEEYEKLAEKIGSEFAALVDASRSDIETATLPEIAEGIMRVREGRLYIEPGYDGEYGKVKIFEEGERKKASKQASLF